MKRLFSGTFAMLLAWQLPVSAADHLVSVETIQRRLNGVATDRAKNAAVIESILESPELKRALEASGISSAPLKGRLATLTDNELRELSQRAADLKADPVAGMSVIGQLALVVLLALVILLVVVAANPPFE